MKSITLLLMAAFSIVTIAAFSQEKAGKKDTTKHTVYYTCPMHDTVRAANPGKCPVCGMKLELSQKEQMKIDVVKSYSCPMHPDVISANPGKCPKCGSSLVSNPSSKEKMKMEVMMYTCPMHPDEMSDKPGKCPKCGMTLTKGKSKI